VIQKAYGDAALSRTIFEWHKRFREGRKSVKDDERSGRPTTSRTDDNIAAVQKMIKEERNVMSRLIAYTLGIPKTVVLRFLREYLKKRKLCSRFDPHAPTREQMDERVAACQDLLNMINGDKNFLDKVTTGDESWRFAYDPEKSVRDPNGLANILHHRRKCASKNQVMTMPIGFLTTKALCTKSSCKKVALLMQHIIKMCYTS